MCGILLVVEPGASAGQQVQYYEAGLKARGPDHFGAVQVTAPSAATSHGVSSNTTNTSSNTDPSEQETSPGFLSLHMAASLLQLRGDSPSTSPLQDSDGNILCFNGEIFSGLDIPVGGNDGKALLASLQQAAATPGAALVTEPNSLSAQCTAEAADNISAEADFPQPGLQTASPDSSKGTSSAAAAEAGAEAVVAAGVMGVLSKLRGPWSLIYWQKQQQRLWFGRDVMGKRSLVLQVPQQDQHPARLVLTSITPQQQQRPAAEQQQQRNAEQPVKWIEVPPGVYSTSSSGLQSVVVHGSHTSCNTGIAGGVSSSGAEPGDAVDCRSAGPAAAVAGGTFLPAHLRPAGAAGSSAAAAAAKSAGNAATADELPNGGVSTASHLCALLPGLQYHLWQDTQLLQLQPYFRSGIECTADCVLSERLSERQHSNDLEAAAQMLLTAMQAAVDVRCLTVNTLQQHCQQQEQQPLLQQDQQQLQQQRPQGSPHLLASSAANAAFCALPPAPVLILFSGGVDSTLIAALAHNALPLGVPIDLSNVCFDGGQSADRAAARSAVLELAAYAPDRPWRLIQVDSSLQEVDQLAQHIRSLLLPAATVMDWNIGSALWLAARAEGQVWVPMRQPGPQQEQQPQQQEQQPQQQRQQLEQQQVGVEQMSLQEAPPGIAAQSWKLVLVGSGSSTLHAAAAEAKTQPPRGVVPSQQQQQQQQQMEVPGSSMYRSAARVVLLGHGADEQCGGYGRHRTKFREAGWQGVADELALDVNRLWLRNLGRDDRLVADHGREGRHPFLDEVVMSVLQQMPLQVMVDYSKPPGEGDKRILRHLLASLGLPQAAGREKRAIQFGSRIGQLSNKRDFGSNRQANKRQAGSLKVAVASAQQV